MPSSRWLAMYIWTRIYYYKVIEYDYSVFIAINKLGCRLECIRGSHFCKVIYVRLYRVSKRKSLDDELFGWFLIFCFFWFLLYTFLHCLHILQLANFVFKQRKILVFFLVNYINNFNFWLFILYFPTVYNENIKHPLPGFLLWNLSFISEISYITV